MYGCVFHHIYVTMFFRNLFLLTEGGTENESGCNYIISYRDSSGYHHCSIIFLRQESTEKQAEQQELLDANKQTVSMLIIDKKRMKMKDAGLPQMVIDQTPKMMRGSKLPIIKAKVGPQIVSLICDEKIFESVPVKKEVKAVVSGIYVLDVKGLHGKTEAAPEKKKGFFKRMIASAQEKAGAKPVK